VLAQLLARHIRLPGIVILLAFGAVLGPDVLGWVEPRALGQGLFGVVDLAVAVILFEGGLNLEISRLRREQTPIRRLVVWGALVTLAGAAVAARVLLEWPWVQSVLFGSLVVVTGPTVVTPLVRALRLRPRVATVLEAEGVLIDPVGAILAVLVLEIVLAPSADTLAIQTTGLLVRIGFGVACGAAAGVVLALLLRQRHVVPEGLENIFTLGSVLLLYQGCDAVVSTSGIVAVTVTGVVVGNLRTPVDRDLREFKDQLTVLLVGLLFILLAADVRLDDVRALGWQGIALVGALVLVVRPLNVALMTAGSDLSGKERAFIAWVAPRGIVAAAIASITASAMETYHLEGGNALRALVFLTIAGTVLLAGLTAGPVAKLLGVALPGRDTVAILGANGLGLALGEEFRGANVPVLFVDSNAVNCGRAEEAGFRVIFGNALEERTLQRGRFDLVGTVIGLTPNETLNSMFIAEARELFAVPRRYVAVASVGSGITPQLRRSEAEILFEAPHDVGRWDVRSRHGELEVGRFVYRRVEESEGEGEDRERPVAPTGERCAILTIRRGERLLPMSAGTALKEGDVAAIALYVPERDAIVSVLSELGWEEEPQ
jgi:NhaP-type Na+/H+ or K+/H+ antiporter